MPDWLRYWTKAAMLLITILILVIAGGYGGFYVWQSVDKSVNTGSIMIESSPPAANVYLDKMDVEGLKTPRTFNNVSAGTHRIRLTKPGYQDWIISIDLNPGDLIKINAELLRKK